MHYRDLMWVQILIGSEYHTSQNIAILRIMRLPLIYASKSNYNE